MSGARDFQMDAGGEKRRSSVSAPAQRQRASHSRKSAKSWISHPDTAQAATLGDAREGQADGAQALQVVQCTTRFATVMCVVIACIKVGVYMITRAAVMKTSALDSCGDLMANGITLYTGYRMSQPDRKRYPVGLGKFESLGCLVFSTLMFSLMFGNALQNVEELFESEDDVGLKALERYLCMNYVASEGHDNGPMFSEYGQYKELDDEGKKTDYCQWEWRNKGFDMDNCDDYWDGGEASEDPPKASCLTYASLCPAGKFNPGDAKVCDENCDEATCCEAAPTPTPPEPPKPAAPTPTPPAAPVAPTPTPPKPAAPTPTPPTPPAMQEQRLEGDGSFLERRPDEGWLERLRRLPDDPKKIYNVVKGYYKILVDGKDATVHEQDLEKKYQKQAPPQCVVSKVGAYESDDKSFEELKFQNIALGCCATYKLFLWLYCILYAIPKSKSNVLVALATDKRNDFCCTYFVIISTILLTTNPLNTIHKDWMFIPFVDEDKMDAFISLLLSFFIMYSWAQLMLEHVSLSAQGAADDDFVQGCLLEARRALNGMPFSVEASDLMVYTYACNNHTVEIRLTLLDGDPGHGAVVAAMEKLERELLHLDDIGRVIVQTKM